MTDKQPEALAYAGALASELDHQAAFHESQPEYSSAWVQASRCRNAAALLRTQHAAIERKDALLRLALETLENDVQLHCYLPSRQHHLQTVEAINKELSQ